MTSPTILFCWEYGAGLGHTASLQVIAEHIKSLGGRFILAVPENADANPSQVFDVVDRFPATEWFRLDQAATKEPIVSYNAAVKDFGFDDPKFLFTRLTLWKKLYEQYAPDLVIADFAPTALMAAKGEGIHTVAIGNGYTLPPVNVSTYPRFMNLPDPVDGNALLASINQALNAARLKPIDFLPQIFQSDIHACFTESSLDPYVKVRNPKAIGPLFSRSPARHEPGNASKIFVYLTHCKRDTAHSVLDALMMVNRPVDIVSLEPVADKRHLAKQSNLNFLETRLSLETICERYCLAIHLTSHNFTMEFLYAGMPQLLLPKDMEKVLLAHGMANHRFAHQLRIDNPKPPEQIAAAIEGALKDQDMTERVGAFSNENRDYKWHENLDQLKAGIEKLLGQR